MSGRRRVIVLQHAAPETLGTIEEALLEHGLDPVYVRVFAGDGVPEEPGDAAGLIVMGGPMSVYEQEQYPHLREELRLIEQVLKQERPLLGVCLGSQLLASALGSPVFAGRKKEIGWHAIRFTPEAGDDLLWRRNGASSTAASQSHVAEDELTVFHWHGDVFTLPQGAVHLASSQLTQVQIFRYGTQAYGFLCHFEVNAHLIASMQTAFAGELKREGISIEQMDRETQLYLKNLQSTARTLWERWAQLAASQR